MQGFDKTVISQYQSAPIIQQLVSYMDQWIDPSVDIDLWFQQVWDIDTAVGFGLDCWGRIVGVTRVVTLSSGGKHLGFQEGGTTDYDPFNQSPFNNGPAATTNYYLSDDAYRLLILAKALANITNGSCPAINQILLNLFPGLGNCYVTDGGNMTMTYTFSFALTPVQLAIVSQSGVLPKPVGVAATVVHP